MSRSEVTVTYLEGDRLSINTGRHAVIVDQPVSAGGDDSGPTPTELFVGSLVACMGYYAQRFLRRNGIDVSGLELKATFDLTEERPHRVSAIDVIVRLPADISDRLLQAVRRVMETCSVHNSIREAPEVTLSLRTELAA